MQKLKAKTKKQRAVERVVEKIAPPLPDIDAYPPWRTMAQTSQYLELSYGTVHTMVRDGKLMTYTVGAKRRVPSSEIKHLMGLADRVRPKRKPEPFRPLREVPNRWAVQKAKDRIIKAARLSRSQWGHAQKRHPHKAQRESVSA